MNDNKHSLAEEKTHSLSEESRPLDQGVHTVGVYLHEEEAREKVEERKPKGGGVGGIIGTVVVALLLLGVFVWIGFSGSTSSTSPTIPPKLEQMTETTNGQSGREQIITREFAGTVVDYKAGVLGENTPLVTFDIGGIQQDYQFRMGNDGKVAVGGTYKVRVQYSNTFWDFVTAEQVPK